jgi:hypothetical protein
MLDFTREGKTQWRDSLRQVVEGLLAEMTEPAEATRQMAERYVPATTQLEAIRILTRIARRHVTAGDRVIWCGEIEGLDGRTHWVLLTTRVCYIAIRRTGDPLAIPLDQIIVDGSLVGTFPISFRHSIYIKSVNGVASSFYDEGVEVFTAPAITWMAAVTVAKHLHAQQVLHDSQATAQVVRDRGHRPSARLVRTARDGELVAAEWMRYWGFADAVATPVGADAGIDVVSETAVAQVKMEAVVTARAVVQGLFGVAAAEQKTPLFFSLAGYSAQALAWGTRVGIGMFTFDLQGQPEPANDAARRLHAG